MLRAISTAIVGLGVTLASTFAPSLGLSVHQQRIGFAVGVALILVAGVVLWIDRKHRSRGNSNPKGSHGIVIEKSKGGRVKGNRVSGFDIGVGVYDSEGIETGGNEINKSDGTPDPCGDPKERLKELAKSARRLEHHLANFDSWRPAVANKDFDGCVDGRHTTHAAAMQTLLFGFARFFSAAWTYEEQCDTHGDWNEVMEWVRDVYRALSVDPSGLDDYPLMSEPLHEVGERSTPGFGKADARPIQLVEFRTQMADDPRFAEYFEPLRTLLKKASPNGPDTPARARLRAVEKSVKRVEERLAAKDFRP